MQTSARFILLVALCGVVLPGAFGTVRAQSPHEDVSSVERAKVLRVVESDIRLIPGTETEHLFQTIEAMLLSGSEEGRVVDVQNDFLKLKEGDRFFTIRYVDVEGTETYSVQDVDRRGSLVLLLALFVLAIVAFGGWYGVRALVSLGASFFVLAYVLMPGLLAGWPPLLTAFGVAGAVLGGALFITHGCNRESLVAFGGTLLAVGATLLFATWSVSFTALSGFAGDESVYLNFNTRGTLDLVALLVGGIVIGAIGVLDDVAITQVSVVRELFRAMPGATRSHVFARSMRVGREHVGAVVNTLALAYVGVSLPLVLLMQRSPIGATAMFNMELFATEVVRTVVGSFGIVLAVPCVTFLAVKYLKPAPDDLSDPQRVVHSNH
jgi:uncharacterized membrane protein